MFYKKYGLRLALILFMTLLALQSEAGTRGSLAIETRQGERVGFYSGSHALLIGASDYGRDWPDLYSVPEELDKVEDVLADHGFEVQKVLNPDSEGLKQAFFDFIYEYGFDQGNRLLFFFSGHGYTRQQGTKGYLVPVDAPDPRQNLKDFLRKSLDMTRIRAWSLEMTAKHALFLFDSCFSGIIFQTKSLPEHPPHITELTPRRVKQFISAGDADEEVPSKSVFTPAFIKALRGEADFTKDGYVTGTELGMYLKEKVPFYNPSQTPQYGKINHPDHDDGDFVFLAGGLTAGPGSISIYPTPKDARVRIMNINQAYKEGMQLKPGEYHIRVDKPGYATEERRVMLRGGHDLEVLVELSHEDVLRVEYESSLLFSRVTYLCRNANCTEMTWHSQSGSSKKHSFTIQKSKDDKKHTYRTFVYNRCYAPMIPGLTVDSDTGAGPWTYKVTFQKKKDCYAPVKSISLAPSSVDVGDPVTVYTNINAVWMMPDGIQGMPIRLSDIYANPVSVFLDVDGQIIKEKDINITWGQTKLTKFRFIPNDAGYKDITILTRVDEDCECAGFSERSKTEILTVNGADHQ